MTIEAVRKKDHRSFTVKLGRAPGLDGSLFSGRDGSFPFGGRHSFGFRMFSDMSTAGMSVQSLTDQLRDYFGAPDGVGILVSEVEDGSAAAKAGIKAGDVLTKVDGEEVNDVQSLRDALSTDESKDMAVELLRKGKSVSVTLHVEGDENEDDSSMLEIRPFRYHDGRSLLFRLPRFHSFPMQELKEELRNLEMKLKDRLRDVREEVERGLSEL